MVLRVWQDRCGTAVEQVSEPYCVIHSGEPVSTTLSSGSIIPIIVTQNNLWDDVIPGAYTAQLATVTHTYYHEFETGSQVLGHWDRASSMIGTHESPDVDGRTWAGYSFGPLGSNIMEVTAITHAWKIIELDEWFPADPSELRTAFSLHVMNAECWGPSMVSLEEIENQATFTVFPNPANDHLYITLTGVPEGEIEIVVIDAVGRTVASDVLSSGTTSATMSLNGLASGTYQIRATTSSARTLYSRFIKL